MEFRDDALQVFYVLDIVNNARTRVDIGGPLIIDLPTGAGGAAVLEGSSPSATVERRSRHGDRTVRAGRDVGAGGVPAAATTARTSPCEQTWPVAAAAGDRRRWRRSARLSMSSPQFSTVGEVKAEDGHAVPAGQRPGAAGRRHADRPALEPPGA